MHVFVDPDRRRADLNKSTFLARGGEGEIHIDPNFPRARVLKLYHQPEKRRAEKLARLLAVAPNLPREVVAPLALARDGRGKVLGFQMRQLNRRFVKASELFRREFCEATGFNQLVKSTAYVKVAEQLDAIHNNRSGTPAVVGDLNDGAFMINQDTQAVAWVDVDSWQLPGYPCIVGTEAYLCPHLYGRDLSIGSHYEVWHDWYSYSVLLFRTLLRKHPFRAGLHPTLHSVLQRAEAGVTVLDSGVTPPDDLKVELLSDELIEALLKQLKGHSRAPFPVDVLRSYRDQLIECSSCGLWYPGRRKLCPGCAIRTTVDFNQLLELVETDLLVVQGRILCATSSSSGKGRLGFVIEENGKLVVYSGLRGNLTRTNTSLPYAPTMKVELRGEVLIIADDRDPDSKTTPLYLLEVKNGMVTPIKATTTNILQGSGAVLAGSSRFTYRLAQNMLLACERFGSHDLLERPVTQVFENQCWFACDPAPSQGLEVVCGYNRDLSAMRWFISSCPQGKSVFTTHSLALSALRRGETLLDLALYFHAGRCLIARLTRYRGAEEVKLDLVDAASARILYSSKRLTGSHPAWESVRGKGFVSEGDDGVVMHPTDQGIVREQLGSGDSPLLSGSRGLVAADDQLFPLGGSIMKVGSTQVSAISKRTNSK